MSNLSPESNQSFLCSNEEDGDNLHLKSQGLGEYHKMYKKSAAFKYMECLKNHAAHMGRVATDGCGEFIPDGKEGTIEFFKCSACECHRNFHRRVQFQNQIREVSYNPQLLPGQPSIVVETNVSGAVEFSLASENQTLMVNAGRKRHRTKFTQEQKEKMLSFAEKADWKMPDIEDSKVRDLCQEIGIKRKILKVWMHNNKYQKVKKNVDENKTG